MKNAILTHNIWQEITAAAKNSKTRSYVAVAYLGQKGAALLPLGKGSKLVVDASEGAVKSGQTDPRELIKLYKSGVEIYSHQGLHAKVFVLGTRLFIGSTNVSERSQSYLQEAVFTTTERTLVNEAKEFIASICVTELGPAHLKQLSEIYRPPRVPQAKEIGVNEKKGKKERTNIFVAHLDTFWEYSKGFEEPFQQGMQEAKKKKSIRHVIDHFEWTGRFSGRQGDTLIQVTKEGNKQWVSPPGKILSIKKWDKDKHALIFLEVPDKRRKSLEVVNKKIGHEILKKNYKLNSLELRKVAGLWE